MASDPRINPSSNTVHSADEDTEPTRTSGGGLLPGLEFETLLPGAPFSELHSRTVDLPVEDIWQNVLNVTGNDIKLLKPLFQLRGLPASIRGKVRPSPEGDRPALELFEQEGFMMLRRDEHPIDGYAVLIFGAIGRFWLPASNAPKRFDSPADFIAFNEPGYAKTVARFQVQTTNGRTYLETETLVDGTDRASTNKFRAYWMLIRGPSGLLRRSWLAAIVRRSLR